MTTKAMGVDMIVEDAEVELVEEGLPPRRPSLFLASRLARLVRKFTHRLQEKVNSRHHSNGKINPFGTVYQRGFRLRALSDLER